MGYGVKQQGRIRNYKQFSILDLSSFQYSGQIQTGIFCKDSDIFNFFFEQRMEASQRARLVQGTQSLNRATESVARSHQVAAETDDIGTEILGELGRQRDVLVRTKGRVSGGLILNPFQNNGIFHKATYINNVEMIHCVSQGVKGHNFQKIIVFLSLKIYIV